VWQPCELLYTCYLITYVLPVVKQRSDVLLREERTNSKGDWARYAPPVAATGDVILPPDSILRPTWLGTE